MPKKLSENDSESPNDFMDVNKKKFETLFSSFIEAPPTKRDKSKAVQKKEPIAKFATPEPQQPVKRRK